VSEGYNWCSVCESIDYDCCCEPEDEDDRNRCERCGMPTEIDHPRIKECHRCVLGDKYKEMSERLR